MLKVLISQHVQQAQVSTHTHNIYPCKYEVWSHITPLVFQYIYRLESPGGGGYGPRENDEEEEENTSPHKRRRTDPVASHKYVEKGSVHAYRMAQESA